MKFLLKVLFLIVISLPLHAEQTRFLGFDSGQKGIGLLAGQPSGLRYVYWLNWKHALFADLVYDFDGIAMAQGSYAFYFYDAKDQWRKKKGSNSFLFYVSPGISAGVRVIGSDTASSVVLGVRGAGGLEYIFGPGSWAARAEIGGNLNLLGRTLASIQGMIGLTYYFDGSSHKTKEIYKEEKDLRFNPKDNKKKKDEFDDEFGDDNDMSEFD
jgi:hypothetical protein